MFLQMNRRTHLLARRAQGGRDPCCSQESRTHLLARRGRDGEIISHIILYFLHFSRSAGQGGTANAAAAAPVVPASDEVDTSSAGEGAQTGEAANSEAKLDENLFDSACAATEVPFMVPPGPRLQYIRKSLPPCPVDMGGNKTGACTFWNDTKHPHPRTHSAAGCVYPPQGPDLEALCGPFAGAGASCSWEKVLASMQTKILCKGWEDVKKYYQEAKAMLLRGVKGFGGIMYVRAMLAVTFGLCPGVPKDNEIWAMKLRSLIRGALCRALPDIRIPGFPKRFACNDVFVVDIKTEFIAPPPPPNPLLGARVNGDPRVHGGDLSSLSEEFGDVEDATVVQGFSDLEQGTEFIQTGETSSSKRPVSGTARGDDAASSLETKLDPLVRYVNVQIGLPEKIVWWYTWGQIQGLVSQQGAGTYARMDKHNILVKEGPKMWAIDPTFLGRLVKEVKEEMAEYPLLKQRFCEVINIVHAVPPVLGWIFTTSCWNMMIMHRFHAGIFLPHVFSSFIFHSYNDRKGSFRKYFPNFLQFHEEDPYFPMIPQQHDPLHQVLVPSSSYTTTTTYWPEWAYKVPKSIKEWPDRDDNDNTTRAYLHYDANMAVRAQRFLVEGQKPFVNALDYRLPMNSHDAQYGYFKQFFLLRDGVVWQDQKSRRIQGRERRVYR